MDFFPASNESELPPGIIAAMSLPKASRLPAILICIVFCMGWSACSPGPVLETQAPTVPGVITPYWTRTPDPDVSPVSSPARSPTPLPSPTPTPMTYRVAQGDTMLGIALRFGISLEELMAANPEVDPRFLSIDTELVIPLGESSPPPFVMPTPVPVDLGELSCYPTGEGGAWCFWPVVNERTRPLENLSARIFLYSTEGEVMAEELAIPPLNLIPGESTLPLIAFFPPPLHEFIPQGELLTALPVRRNDERYLEAKLQIEEVIISTSGLQAALSGEVSLPRNSKPASLVWLAAVAYGEDGSVVGVRKWEAVVVNSGTPAGGTPLPTSGLTGGTPVPGQTGAAPQAGTSQAGSSGVSMQLERPLGGGESLPFEIEVFSLGPPIQEVEVLVEARP